MENPNLLSTFNNAYSNICSLIEERRIKKHHCQIFWVSLLTLLVLVATVANTIYGQNQVDNKKSVTAVSNLSN
jgi:hypothetical protein